jgi:hypothetical protein
MGRERDEFVALLAHDFSNIDPFTVIRHAKAIMRYAKTHQRLAIAYCNGEDGITSENWHERAKKPRAAILANYGALLTHGKETTLCERIAAAQDKVGATGNLIAHFPAHTPGLPHASRACPARDALSLTRSNMSKHTPGPW